MDNLGSHKVPGGARLSKRTLLSEGCIKYEFVEKTARGLRQRRIVREGPTNVVLTTRRFSLHPENEISVPIDDSPEQTMEIMRESARPKQKGAVSFREWHGRSSRGTECCPASIYRWLG